MALTFDQVSTALNASKWIYAKTMPQWPHEYTLKRDWQQTIDFEDVVQFIYDHGYRELFKPTGNKFMRLNVGDHKYWSVGEPMGQTTLINRTTLDDPFSEAVT